jgi:hypothetical protein
VRHDIYARTRGASPGAHSYDYALGPIGYAEHLVAPRRPRLSYTAGSVPSRSLNPVARPKYSGQRPGETDVEFFNRMRRSQAEEAVKATIPWVTPPRSIRYPEAGRVVDWHAGSVGPQGPRPPVLHSYDMGGGARAYPPSMPTTVYRTSTM